MEIEAMWVLSGRDLGNRGYVGVVRGRGRDLGNRGCVGVVRGKGSMIA